MDFEEEESEELGRDPEDDTILCHMGKKEVAELSRAQGGEDRNNEWQIVQFVKLGQLLDENEEFRDKLGLAIDGFFNVDKHQKKNIADELENFTESKLGKAHFDQAADENENPLAQELGKMGKGSDSEIVLMPKNLFEFLWERSPEEYMEINEKTGLPQFEEGSFLLSLIGGVIGTLIAPGIGTAIGSGLGHLGGSYIEEIGLPDNKKSSFFQKAVGALGAGALGYMGGNLWNGAPLETVLSGYAPWIAGGGILGNEVLNEQRKKENKFSEAQKKNELTAIENKKAHDEYEKKFNPILKLQTADNSFWKNNPNYEASDQRFKFKSGGKIDPIIQRSPIKNSQYIDGNFDGQADNIHVDVPEGSYVLDAQTVAHIGDGNSKAGAEYLKKFVKKIPSIYHSSAMVPCALSSGEYVITSDIVKGIGDGNIKKGQKLLDKFVKKLREQKGATVAKIPSPSKDIESYIPELRKVI